MIKNKMVWLFTSFYLMHIIGMIYTDNTSFGLFDLEIKLSFLLFPIMFASFNSITSKSYYNILLALVFGCAVAGLANLGMGYLNFQETGDIREMLYGQLSFFHHPTYFAMYIVLCVTFMIHALLFRQEYIPNSNKRLFLVLIPFFILMVILLMSKSGLLSLLLLLIITIGYAIVKKNFRLAGGVTAAIVLSVGIALYAVPGVFDRIASSITIAFQSTDEIDASTIESTAGRILVWSQAVELIKDHPLIGVGTGDVKEALVKKYAESGMDGIEEKRLNAHNQFLQSFAALGIFGFMSLVLGLFIASYKAIRQNNLVYVMFILIIVVNALTESILEVQAGVIFYAFFNSFFMFLNPISIRKNIP